MEWYIGYRWFDFRFSWGYNLAKAYNVNELAGGIVSLATLISGVAFAPNNTAELAVKVPEKIANAINGAEIGASIANNQLTVNPWGWLNLNHLNGNAFFTVMIMGALSTIIFCKLMQADLTIKCLILYHQQFQKRLRQFYQQQSHCMS